MEEIRNKIIFTSDLHLGYNPPLKRDMSNISCFTWDNVRFYEKFCDYLIARGDVLLIVDTGDFFDAKNINTTIQRYIHKNIILKLRKARIGVLFITGNHDSFSDNKDHASDMDFFDHYLEQNCIVVNEWCAFNPMLSSNQFYWLNGSQDQKINTWWQKLILPALSQANIGFCLFPYKDEAYIKDIYYRSNIDMVSNEDFLKIKRTLTTEKLQQFVSSTIITKMLNHVKDMTTIAGLHFRLENSKLNRFLAEDTYTNEFKFGKEMLPFSLSVAGHIHLPQSMFNSDTILHIGSLMYTDFGELQDEKNYGIYDITTKKLVLKSVVFDKAKENEPRLRKVTTLSLKVPENCPDPTQYIITDLQKREKDLRDGIVKINIIISPTDDLRLELNKVMQYADSAIFFSRIEISHTEINELSVEKQEVIENINLQSMFDTYIKKYANLPNFNLIQKFGNDALTQALQMNISGEKE